MTQDTINLLDDVDPGDVLEIHYLAVDGTLRTGVGEYSGLAKDADGDWVIQRTNRPDIKTLDIREIVVLTKARA